VIKRISGILIITLLALGAFLPPLVSQAQVDGRLYIPETGHWITNDFLTTYQSVSDPQAIFGYPITDAFMNVTSGRLVQYFQRALFELRPENPAELRVEIKVLGEYLYQKGDVLPIPLNFPACQYFPETEHQICYAFLDFFKANGGIAQFGYPISEIEIHSGRLVQYFQRACFEWHPEFAPGKRVTLADLGLRYFYNQNEDPSRLVPKPENMTIRIILSLQARAFPETAVLAPRGNQSLYVIIQDQNLMPVSNATVILTVKYPSGKEEPYVAPLTDDNGITKIQFLVSEQTQGIVNVSIKASYDSLEDTTRTSFRIWW
jgi:hypothetical protein